MTRRTLLLSGAAVTTLRAAHESAKESTATGAKVKVGIIGTGHRAWAHIAALKSIPDFEIVGLADPTPSFLERAASLAGPGVPTYSTHQQLFAGQKDLQAVFVVTPGGLHTQPVSDSLAHGLHVLQEKPMATSLADANRIIEAAEKSGRILQVGQQMRSTPIYQKVYELIQGGEIGSVQFVSGNLFRGDWNPRSWQVPDPQTGQPTIWRFLTKYTGSSLLEDGIHEIDVLNWIVGSRVKTVYATGGNNVLKGRETIDHATVTIEYENGVKVNFGFSLFAPSPGSIGRQMAFLGTNGIITIESGHITVRKRGGNAQTVEASAQTPRDQFKGQVGKDLDVGTYRQAVAFLNSIRTGARPVCDGQVGREVMSISLLAEQSLRERRIVHWSDLSA